MADTNQAANVSKIYFQSSNKSNVIWASRRMAEAIKEELDSHI